MSQYELLLLLIRIDNIRDDLTRMSKAICLALDTKDSE